MSEFYGAGDERSLRREFSTALIVALVSVTAAYYAMWVLALLVFALAVYYTVKQL